MCASLYVNVCVSVFLSHANVCERVWYGHAMCGRQFDFLVFCLRNPKACPLLDITRPDAAADGRFAEPSFVAPGADLRSDVPLYCIWRNGEVVERLSDVRSLWTADSPMVGFLLGCSFSWEDVLASEAGVVPRHVELQCNVPMFETNIPVQSAGVFAGSCLVVSMRPVPPERVRDVVAVTARYPGAHGAPVHVGDPAAIGIADLARPQYGDPVALRPGEVPVFWACGVTPQAALRAAALPFAITHAPGHMFVTDLLDKELCVSI